MKTIIALEIEVSRKVPELAELISGRAYTISGVEGVRVLSETTESQDGCVAELERREPIL